MDVTPAGSTNGTSRQICIYSGAQANSLDLGWALALVHDVERPAIRGETECQLCPA